MGPAFHGETIPLGGGTPALAKLGTGTYICVDIYVVVYIEDSAKWLLAISSLSKQELSTHRQLPVRPLQRPLLLNGLSSHEINVLRIGDLAEAFGRHETPPNGCHVVATASNACGRPVAESNPRPSKSG